MFWLCTLIPVAVLCPVGVVYCIRYFRQKEEPLSKKQTVVLAAVSAVVLAAIAVFFSLTALPHEWSVHSLLRTFGVLIFSWFAAVIDLKYKVIPNKLSLCMLILGVLSIGIEIAMAPVYWKYTLMNALIGAGIAGGIFLLANLVSKNGLGMGDVKLMALIGLYLGLEGALGAAMWAMVTAALAGGIMMAVKKAKLKTELALAPFFFLGTLVSNAFFLISGLIPVE